MKKLLVSVVAAVLCAALSPAVAFGALQVTIIIGSDTETIVDGDIEDSDPATNSLSITDLTVGGYTFNSTLTSSSEGLSLSSLQGGTNTITYQSGTELSVRMIISDDGFITPNTATMDAAIAGTFFDKTSSEGPAGTVTVGVDSYIDLFGSAAVLEGDALQLAADTATVTTALFPNDQDAFSDSELGFTGVGAPYALYFIYDFTFTAEGQVVDIDGTLAVRGDGTGNIPPLPEPGSMLVWGLGLSMVAAGGYWRRRKVVA